MSTTDLIEENRDTLETVANADCSASWIAEELLSSVEGETSYSTEEANRTTTQTTTEPENDIEVGQDTTDTENGIKDSIFAY